jgi:hypothetical protein
MPKFLRVKENITHKTTGPSLVKAAVIAEIYDVTPTLIYKWANDGKIPSIRFMGTRRFDLAAVRNVIEGGKGQAQ